MHTIQSINRASHHLQGVIGGHTCDELPYG